MESLSEVKRRQDELLHEAPIHPAGLWAHGWLDGHEVYFLCGTIGSAFDQWQRKVSVLSAADALFSQQIGLDAVERVMDEMESEVRKKVEDEGRGLRPRWSPGYGSHPLSLSRLILDRLDASRRLGVSLTDSNILVPLKSVTAVCEII